MSEASRTVTAGARARLTWPLALAAVSVAWLPVFAAWPVVANMLGLAIGEGWFIDLYALLAAADAHVRGLNVYDINPLDVYGRPHSYSNWWLMLSNLGLTRGDTRWLGIVLVTLFLIIAIVTLRPARAGAFWLGACVLASPAVHLAVVRANNDLVVFLVLAAVVPCLRSALPTARLAAVVLIAVATGLKYYPAVALLLLLHEDSPRLFVWRLVLGLALCAIVVLGIYEDSLYFSRTLPTPSAFFSFGAPALLSWLHVAPAAKWIALGGVVALGLASSRTLIAAPVRATREELYFALGAVLVGACFWATMNWAYRWVFSLWLVPLLCAVPAESRLVPRWQCRLLCWLLPVVLWWDGVCSLFWNLGPHHLFGVTLDRYSEVCWLAIQPAQWLVCCLLTITCVRFAIAESAWLFGRFRLELRPAA
jgi:hypothetical protein